MIKQLFEIIDDLPEEAVVILMTVLAALAGCCGGMLPALFLFEILS